MKIQNNLPHLLSKDITKNEKIALKFFYDVILPSWWSSESHVISRNGYFSVFLWYIFVILSIFARGYQWDVLYTEQIYVIYAPCKISSWYSHMEILKILKMYQKTLKNSHFLRSCHFQMTTTNALWRHKFCSTEFFHSL